ncbi:MAG: ice-binding family protein [Candidatus Saccharimonadales bacterium]
MIKINEKLVVGMLITTFTLGLIGISINSPIVHAAQATVDLKTAEPFAILSGTPNITDAGGASVITGNAGLYPGPGSGIGLLCSQVAGTVYARDLTGNICFTEDAPLLLTAKNDLSDAYDDASGRTPVTALAGADNQLGGQTLTAGVYSFGHATTANLTAASPLTLDAQNDPDAVFIFQASSDLITASSSVVRLVNDAQSCNVFWQVTSSATLGTSSEFIGTIMALTSIGLNTSATMDGRALARNGAVTLDHNTITVPVCTVPIVPPVETPVVTPKLPNTGFAPINNNILSAIGISAGIIIVALLSFFIVQKKHKA